MNQTLVLKKDTYTCAKISALKSNLINSEKINSLLNKSFEEILKVLEENSDFKKSIDKWYTSYEGFYLIEKILNDVLSSHYSKIFRSANKNNRKLLELFYTKYQIQNFMSLVRCKKAQEDNLEIYLVGESRKQEKFLKAIQMPNFDDSIIYICKKLKFKIKKVKELIDSNLYELENYLYKEYYEKLSKTQIRYNNKDEKEFISYIRKYIDLVNLRLYIKTIKNKNVQLNFEDLFIGGGKQSLSVFKKIEGEKKNFKEIIKSLPKEFELNNKNVEVEDFFTFEKFFSNYEKKVNKIKAKASFSSPFSALIYFFELEREIAKLRIILKAKFLQIEAEEIRKLIE